jgi:hypothetical protein
MVAKSLGARAPRKRVRVSDSCPVTRSTSVRSSTPFWRPMFRNSDAASVAAAASSSGVREGEEGGGVSCDGPAPRKWGVGEETTER